MTPQEVAMLLTAAAAVDDRIDPDEARVTAWAAILYPDCPYDVARDALVRHYRSERRCIMPADVNDVWRSERERRRSAAESERRQLEAGRGIPMPDELKALLRTFTAKTRLPNA